MSALPPFDPEENRTLIAERMGWPDGAVEACRDLEREFPSWTVYWVSGELPAAPRRGFQAIFDDHHHRMARAFGETPEELRENLAAANDPAPGDYFF